LSERAVDVRRSGGEESRLVNAPAARERSGAGNEEVVLDANRNLLSPEALAFAARVREAAAMRDKSYRASPIGGEVGRFLRALRWSDHSENTLLSYETTLSRLAVDFAHLRSLSELTTDRLRGFLDEHWAESSPATKRQRLAALKSFLEWGIAEERGIDLNPLARVKPPRRKTVERRAYEVDVVERLANAQALLRDRIAIRLLGRLGLRRNELRMLQVQDFDIGSGTVRIDGKGGKVVVLPLAFKALKRDLETHLLGRNPVEFLLYAKNSARKPMSYQGVQDWFKRCLRQAELPTSIQMHELRHSAADALYRNSGDIGKAQQLLRHESPATTAGYLHPRREDLEAALEVSMGERSKCQVGVTQECGFTPSNLT
jgi:site-specific recombinase XerD